MDTTTAQLAGIQYRLPYTNRDFASLLASIQAKIPKDVQEWNDVQLSNYGIFILGTVAALVDWLAFYMDRSAAESYILTCVGKSSIANTLQLINYQLRGAVPAYTTLRISIPEALDNDVNIPQYSEFVDSSGTNRFVTTSGATIVAGDLYVDIPARQGSWQTENYTGDGAAQQRLILGRTDIAEGFIRVWVGVEEWSLATDNTFVGAEPWEQLFRVIHNSISAPGPEDATPATAPELVVTTVEFGDGLEGAIPNTGAQIRVDYLVTSGDSVRIPAGAINQVVSEIFDAGGDPVTNISVINTQSAAGGDSSESLYAARRNYPKQFRTMRRAVTTYDYRAYAESFPGVLLARVFDIANNADNNDNITPDRPIPVEQSIPFYQIHVYAIPRHDWSSYALNRVLQKWLQDRAPIDRQVIVVSPQPVGVDIRVVLRVYSSYDANSVKFNAVQAIQKYFTLTRDGEIQIGSTFRTSRLISILQQLPGVASLDFIAGIVGQPPAQDLTPEFAQILQINTITVTLSTPVL